MGYNLKTTYCDIAEFEKGEVTTISAIFGPNCLEHQNTDQDSFVDLKLGSPTEFKQGLTTNNLKYHKPYLMDSVSSSSGSSKRARTPSSGIQVVSCLVDGCNSDLSKCRDYHRRHKVCEMHSKSARVIIGGHEQRFCQQCSRFHSLSEFDEGKRSCRKRLEGHNRRRRKPQPEPLPVNPGNFLSASQGSRFSSYSNSPMIPPSSMVSSGWSGSMKTESHPTLYSSSGSSSYSQQAYRSSSRQFPFLQGSHPPLTTSVCQTTLHNQHVPNMGSGSAPKMLCDGLNQMINSDRALSLLSSTTSAANTTTPPEMGMDLGRIIHPNPNYNNYRNLHQYSSHQTQGVEGHQPEVSTLISNVFQGGNDDGSSSAASGGHQTLSFSWE